uniref:Uncharacterized protein n=1 Tax=Gossypium raimondii TaxID=29730 RepID=A0A0D2QY90_GOSRA|nr:hypothetical protein B456_007G237700 [Gossypium raimondii]
MKRYLTCYLYSVSNLLLLEIKSLTSQFARALDKQNRNNVLTSWPAFAVFNFHTNFPPLPPPNPRRHAPMANPFNPDGFSFSFPLSLLLNISANFFFFPFFCSPRSLLTAKCFCCSAAYCYGATHFSSSVPKS